MALLEPQIEGKYEILDKLREGGMGAIYKVRHRLLDEERVIKVIRPGHAGSAAVERFLREAKAAIRLRHPNVAVLHDFAVGEDGNAFIVMEYIAGWSLLEILQSYGPPPLPLSLEIARQALKALGYLHRHRIVHRDVSPDNLMLTRDVDGQPLLKLIDLGIAKALEDDASAGLTTQGSFLGKPRYASPEQFGTEGTTARSDLYSFGIVLCELLTGKCPIRGKDATSYMAGHLFHPPLGFAEIDPHGTVPEELRRLLSRALAKKPEDRFADAAEFARALARVQESHPYRPRDFAAVLDVLLPLSASGSLPEAPGATQEELDREFLLQETPSPDALLTLVRSDVTVATASSVSWASREMRPEEPAAEVPVEEPVRRRPWIAAAVGAGLLLCGGLGWLAWQLPKPRPETASPAAPAPVSSLPVEVNPGEQAPAPASPEPLPVPPLASPPPGKPMPAAALSTEPVEAVPVPPMQPGLLIRRGDPGAVSPPIPLDLADYAYPEAARGSGRRASVSVEVLVDENGQVLGTRLRDGDKSGLGFNEIALDTARKTRFQPATRDEIPGKMWTELNFDFAEDAAAATPP